MDRVCAIYYSGTRTTSAAAIQEARGDLGFTDASFSLFHSTYSRARGPERSSRSLAIGLLRCILPACFLTMQRMRIVPFISQSG